MEKYSFPKIVYHALRGHKRWKPAWRSLELKKSYDVIVIGGGGHGLATAYYLAKKHGVTNVAVLERGWIGGGRRRSLVLFQPDIDMFRIFCTFCGERDENEFVYGGQAHIARPEPAQQVSDREWAEYLFYRDNPKGVHFERWQHRYGCRQWLNVVRHTVTHEILTVYRLDEAPPDVDREEAV